MADEINQISDVAADGDARSNTLWLLRVVCLWGGFLLLAFGATYWDCCYQYTLFGDFALLPLSRTSGLSWLPWMFIALALVTWYASRPKPGVAWEAGMLVFTVFICGMVVFGLYVNSNGASEQIRGGAVGIVLGSSLLITGHVFGLFEAGRSAER